MLTTNRASEGWPVGNNYMGEIRQGQSVQVPSGSKIHFSKCKLLATHKSADTAVTVGNGKHQYNTATLWWTASMGGANKTATMSRFTLFGG